MINLRVVGQPSMTGPIQRDLEQAFFESLKEKTSLPIKVDYRTIDSMGFKDNHQLAMMKKGMFDIVSLRFLQNGQEEPSIIGIDLPGLNPNFEIARKIGDHYGAIVDEYLQKRFEIKLLGLWTFGPQIIFCNKPIEQLSDLKGLKIRVGGSAFDQMIKDQGGTPVTMSFDQVEEALASKMVDCAITSHTSAYSAKWGRHLTHIYPVSTQMGINGIAISLNAWNKFSNKQKQKLEMAVNAYVDQAWAYSEKINHQASVCMQGKKSCSLGTQYNLISSPVIAKDEKYMREFLMNESFPAWALACNKIHPDCSSRWKETILPILKASPNQ